MNPAIRPHDIVVPISPANNEVIVGVVCSQTPLGELQVLWLSNQRAFFEAYEIPEDLVLASLETNISGSLPTYLIVQALIEGPLSNN